MAALVIDTLSKRKGDRPIYTDLKLDLELNYTKDPRLKSGEIFKDIKVSYDIEAIKNSLFNLFTTMPGQKILNPIYGLNLYQFLFSGISDDNARAMGEMILRGIQKYEPRVQVAKISVAPDPDNNTYEIGLKLNVPSLNIDGMSLKGVLSESGYYIS